MVGFMGLPNKIIPSRSVHSPSAFNFTEEEKNLCLFGFFLSHGPPYINPLLSTCQKNNHSFTQAINSFPLQKIIL